MSNESSVCPFSYRYGSIEMKRIFSRKNIVEKFITVEVGLLRGLESIGFVPRGCWESVAECSRSIGIEDIDELEKAVGHEIASLAIALAEKCGDCGKYVHLGATSNDIIDTAWALIVRDALSIVKKKLRNVIEMLVDMCLKYRDTVMIGRTHGRHALPITFGFKLANYVYELSRSYERICSMEKRVVRGKIAGAVGTMASWFGRGLELEKEVLEALDLEPHAIATQVAPRDGFAELVSVLAILGSQLDRLALEFRELMRDEIGELSIVRSVIGSSTMPHKKNPTIAERVSGLAKVLRGMVLTALENIVLLHERDLTNSSVERFLIPHVFLCIDQMLEDTIDMLKHLEIDEEAMERNLELSGGAIASECIMMKLVLRKGMPRHRAHELLRKLIDRAYLEKKKFYDIVMDSDIPKLIDIEEVRECFDYRKYLGNYKELIDRALSYAKRAVEQC